MNIKRAIFNRLFVLGPLAVLGAALPALAGSGWVSSGGDTHITSQNPWMVVGSDATDALAYCMVVDPGFGLAPETVAAEIAAAFDWWRQEFSQANYDGGAREVFPRTIIHHQSCQPETDIVFQAGWLTPEQRRYLAQPEDFIAAAVRTTYDSQTLRGKGFIYFAPVTGDLRPQKDGLLPGNFWQQRQAFGAFGKVVSHELGHIFGLPHLAPTARSGASADYADHIMAAGTPFALVAGDIEDPFAFRSHVFAMPVYDSFLDLCLDHYPERQAQAIAAFFGIKASDCLALTLRPGKGSISGSVIIGTQVIGTITSGDQELIYERPIKIVREQRPAPTSTDYGPAMVTVISSATFTNTTSGQTKWLEIVYDRDAASLTLFVDGRMWRNIIRIGAQEDLLDH